MLAKIFAALFCLSLTVILEAQIKTVQIATGLDRPVGIVHSGDGSERLFFLLQKGTVRVYDGTRVLSKPFLNIASLVSCCDERGLLSLVFHPDYKSNRFFYVLYTDNAGDVVIARFTTSTNPNIAIRSSKKIVLKVPHRNSRNHYGGDLHFGPDGYLYISLGDGHALGVVNTDAQDLGTYQGKILRIDVSTHPYSIPPTNPFVSTPGAKKEIWAYGLRNPWRFSFDPLTRRAYISDVGDHLWEELNVQPAGKGGRNYGWPVMEGKHCYSPTAICDKTGLVLPTVEYSHSSGCTIIGGYVYRGKKIAELRGRYVYTDLCSGDIFAAKQSSGKWLSTKLLSTGKFMLTSFGTDQAGELYFSHYDGSIHRIEKR